ncbi:MAG: cob(I)yrinic acid a,c-diamide adenosyltransferase, partial [Phycisphaerae bacterium]|nr:cob(I)yrinic acid a,c-diamide adenosyltransferase [Phycisphaerae bacterium]
VITTGRYAPESLIEAADLVTEMKLHKHHITQKIPAQAEIEF